MELYIHIPFCVRKCNYCDFLSVVSDSEFKRRVVDCIIKEIRIRFNELKDSDSARPVISTVFFGGGTPSCLDSDMIESIMNSIYENADIDNDAEITIEANPGTLNLDKLKHYKEIGINRLSMGLQSANYNELLMLGRIHSYEDFEMNYKEARNVGFDNINVDIMTALPSQTISSIENTLRKVISLNPEHISAYSLIIEEGTLFAERTELLDELPSEDSERKIYYLVRDYLRVAGYSQYEISNFARSRNNKILSCRHNVGYWTRDNYIGVGPGAASLIGNVRCSNITSIEDYIERIERGSLAIDDDTIQRLTKEDEMSEFMFLGLRMTDGISEADFKDKFGIDILEVYGNSIEEHISDGTICRDNGRIFLSERGMDVSNYVMSDFLL